jgi:hypothetical protein
MKLRMITTAVAALCMAGGAVMAQGTQAPVTPAPGSTGSPSTPPTHPTERGTPATGKVTGSGSGPSGQAATQSMEEAKQACKNLTGDQAQADCMKKVEQEHKSPMGGDKSSTKPSGSSGKPSGY